MIKHRELFPKNFFPNNAPQQAVLAIRIHLEFIKFGNNEIEKTAQALVDLIVLKYGNHGYLRRWTKDEESSGRI